MLRSIAAFICLIVSFLCPHAGICQPAAGDAAGKKKPAASGIDALELVRVVFIPDRNQQRMRVRRIDVPRVVRKPSDITVQFNVIDPEDRTFFIPVGDDVPGITFRKVEEIGDARTFQRPKFNVKSFKNIVVNGQDVSEITLWDYEHNAEMILPLQKIVDVLDLGRRYAILRYKWWQPGPDGRKIPDFSKRTGQTFTLPPEEEKKYKVIAIEGQTVVIELPDGTRKTLTVPK